ncbi:hypothetical protein [Angustibacter sp. Root456]|uniref:hypothetical protein n=1 Tax=Angustibacter sp. Root456 TaxID=1736539 RepID=UPI0006F9F1F6|nr:hypothetical protein [Angustibacter sp. Root456]KQX69675.1 hypothetical protein ASD06_01080 [Angustibacter sp. Root456]
MSHTHAEPATTGRTRRLTTETKSSTKTSELIAYVLAVLAVVITSLVVGDDGHGSADPFSASRALQLVTYLTIGYMVARGLAKSGSRDAYDAHDVTDH